MLRRKEAKRTCFRACNIYLYCLSNIPSIYTVKSIEFSADIWSLLSCPIINHATMKVTMPLKKEKAVL